MIRSSAILTFAVSLLLGSGQVFSQGFFGVDACAPCMPVEPCVPVETCAPVCGPMDGCQNYAAVICPTHGQAACPAGCPFFAARRSALPQGLGQRLGSGEGLAGWRARPMPQGVPAGPPPSGGFVGSLFAPRQYPYQPQPQPVPGAPQGYVSPPAERIVYVPYAAPPPITVERLGRALPIPHPQFIRRILGDAYMYEYPEMPMQLYTTRGPRDFFAPTPPSIGE